MEDLIKKLIEVDKAAREKVDAAVKERNDLLSEIADRKKTMREEFQSSFEKELEKKKNLAKETIEKDYSPEKTAQKNSEITQKLDAVFEEKCESWVKEIVERAIS